MATDDGEPEVAQLRFLSDLRERVAWQANAADRARRGLPPEPSPAPEPSQAPAAAPPEPSIALTLLEEIASRERDSVRRIELDAYLDALRRFADDEGRLPSHFRELVASVFGDVR